MMLHHYVSQRMVVLYHFLLLQSDGTSYGVTIHHYGVVVHVTVPCYMTLYIALITHVSTVHIVFNTCSGSRCI